MFSEFRNSASPHAKEIGIPIVSESTLPLIVSGVTVPGECPFILSLSSTPFFFFSASSFTLHGKGYHREPRIANFRKTSSIVVALIPNEFTPSLSFSASRVENISANCALWFEWRMNVASVPTTPRKSASCLRISELIVSFSPFTHKMP